MNFTEIDINQKKISIGLPVFNGEEFIRKKLESILSQTFTNFELIISDNASTDSTSEICKEFEKKDKRIRYYKQNKTIAPILNYDFILQKAECEYFLWTAVDDVLLPKFVEKNLEIMVKNKNVVSSVSRMKLYGPMTEYMESKISNKSFFSRAYKKYYQKNGYQDTFPASGNYENRVKEYMKNIRHNQVLYGIYRTEQIKKSFVNVSFIASDAATTLDLLKYGELYVTDEILMEVYDSGMSRSGMIEGLKKMHQKNMGSIFPFFPFTVWCINNLGRRFFLKNLSFFMKINYEGGASLFIDILRHLGLNPESKFLGFSYK
jgi:glycosyltransferase involved in cell wall biosynthesis